MEISCKREERFRRAWLVWALLFVCACLPFLPTLWGEFTWDDDAWVTGNTAVRAGWSGLRAIWDPWHQDLHYYPMVFTLFWVEEKCWGLSSTGFHAVNIALHGSAAVMLWRFLKRIQLPGGRWAPWLGALAWAVHPVQVETVSWVTEGKNTLSALFVFAAAWAYMKSDPRWGRSETVASLEDVYISNTSAVYWYAMAIMLFILALLSKTVVCVLPAVLAVLVWWRDGGVSLHEWKKLIPLFVVGLGLAVLTTQREKAVVESGGAVLHLLWSQRFSIAGKDLAFYVQTLAWPYPLMPIPPRWSLAATTLFTWIPTVIVAIVTILFWCVRKRIGRGVFAAWAIFVVTLTPALGFIDFYTMLYTFVADHYQYLACAGLLVPTVAGVLWWGQQRRRQRISTALVVIVCVGLALLSLGYSCIYRTNDFMWAWNVSHNHEAWNAKHNLAIAWSTAGRMGDAETLVRQAIAQYEPDDRMHRTLGEILDREGKLPEAVHEFQRSIEIDPSRGITYERLAVSLERLGQSDKALEAYARAIMLSPNIARLRFNAAQAFHHAGRFAEAQQEYEADLQLAPADRAGWYNYGNLLLDMKKPADAAKIYEQLIQKWPEFADGWFNLAVAYHEAGKDARAAEAMARGKALENTQSSNSTSPPTIAH